MSQGIEILTCEEMAEADRRAVALGVPSLTLMENAGRAVADEAAKMVPAGAKIAVLCGPGNNGGDGFVAARYLRERGFDVRVSCLVPIEQLKGDAAEMAKRWGGEVEFLAPLENKRDALPGQRKPIDIPDILKSADLAIDALFGAGLNRPLDGQAAELVLRLHFSGSRVLPLRIISVDVPSGLSGDLGDVPGEKDERLVVHLRCVVADKTVTFFRRKAGHLLMPGRAYCGQIILADIGMPVEVLRELEPRFWMNEPGVWRDRLPLPERTSWLEVHKYIRGHAVVVSGPAFQSGAARLAARGALRMGAGLVTVLSPPAALPENAAHLTAIMLKPFRDARDLAEILEDKRKNAVLIGPGCGVGEDTRELVLAALKSDGAVVLDADALTSFAENGDASNETVNFGFTGAAIKHAVSPAQLFAAIRAKGRFPDVVLTPHEGEFKRLFPDLKGSKLDRALAAAMRSGAVIVLKGPDTVIAVPPEYVHERAAAAINSNAPPWLATAGSGDVLAGFITGLLAQGMPAFEAACAAVWLHGECANKFGIGLIAEDLPEVLPKALAALWKASSFPV
jgi:ADP-dependent NAD(P)H-hydrate dehydratase / NAD(P)H-hydrate epimerase